MNNFTHTIENTGFNIYILKNKQNSSYANIFFHGFTAITSKDDFKTLTRSIPIYDNQDSILVHWDSGNIKKTITDSVCDTITDHTSSKNADIKNKLLSLTKLVINKATKRVITDFNANENNSDILAKNLTHILEKCVASHQYEYINLIGHSLGARLVLRGTCNLSDSFTSKIRNIVLMGGAIGWDQKFTPHLEKITNLHLYNLYSSKDFVLIGKPKFEQCIGRNVIPKGKRYRVTNIHCTNYGHTDYWPQFKHLAQKYNLLDSHTIK